MLCKAIQHFLIVFGNQEFVDLSLLLEEGSVHSPEFVGIVLLVALNANDWHAFVSLLPTQDCLGSISRQLMQQH